MRSWKWEFTYKILALFWSERGWFGLILKITVRMKSYKPLKQRYFIKQPDSRAKLSLFSGPHPNYFHFRSFSKLRRNGRIWCGGWRRCRKISPMQVQNAAMKRSVSALGSRGSRLKWLCRAAGGLPAAKRWLIFWKPPSGRCRKSANRASDRSPAIIAQFTRMSA